MQVIPDVAHDPRLHLAVRNIGAGLGIGTGDAVLGLRAFGASLASAADLDGSQVVSRGDECPDGAVLRVQLVGYLLQSEEPQSLRLSILGSVCIYPALQLPNTESLIGDSTSVDDARTSGILRPDASHYDIRSIGSC